MQRFWSTGSRAGAFLVGCALLAACGTGSSGWQGTIEERDGVVRVQNPRRGAWQDRAPAPIRLELEQVFGVEEEPASQILGQIGMHGVTVDGDGNVYVHDRQAHRLLSFAPDGSLRWSAEGEGEGPGEFNRVQGVAWDGESTIWIANANQTRLDRWSTAGRFLGSAELAERGLPTGTPLGFLSPSTIVLQRWAVGSVIAGGRVAILEVEPAWRVVSDFEIEVADRTYGPALAFVSMTLSGGEVSVGDIDSYELRFHDPSGRLTRVVTRQFDELVGYAMAGEHYPSLYSLLTAPARLESGHLLAQVRWVEVDDPDADYARRVEAGTLDERPFRSSLDLFDPAGRFLYAIESDGYETVIGSLELVGPDGRLYTSALEPFPQVRRYRVEIDES